MKVFIAEMLGLAGVSAIGFGLWRICPAALYIYAGVVLCGLCYIVANAPKRPGGEQ
jgi:hypothetical protein